MATDTGTLLLAWYARLDAPMRAEALSCLLLGVYSRALLRSLRATLDAGEGHRRGLDDPHAAQPGEPLGANLQTFLRDRLLRPPIDTGVSQLVPSP
ncbi:MAG: hypothetical protein ACRYF3_01375 [Janthinobacterium lividum]